MTVDVEPNGSDASTEDSAKSFALLAGTLFDGDAGSGHTISVAAGLEIVFPGTTATAGRVSGLSPRRAWFVPSQESQLRDHGPVSIVLRAPGIEVGPIAAKLVPAPRAACESLLGLTFEDVPLPLAQQIVALLRHLADRGEAHIAVRPVPAREEVTDANRIRSIVKALASMGGRGFVGSSPSTAVRITGFDKTGLIRWEGTSDWDAPPFVVELTGYNSLYRLHFDSAEPLEAGVTVTRLPTRIERSRWRQYRRGANVRGLRVTFRNPLWPDTVETSRALRELSFGGLSFVTVLDEDLLVPGLRLELLDVIDEHGARVRLVGEVRSISVEGEIAVARLSVTAASPVDDTDWNRLVGQALYQTTNSGEHFGAAVWDLFRDSGYFSLSGKTPAQFESLRDSYLRVDRMGAVVPGLFCHAVFPSARGVEGSVSIMKVYRRTWMLHQLAKRRPDATVANTRAILRDLYTRAFEHTQTDQGFRWVIAYAEASVYWNQMSHFAFTQRHAGPERAASLPFRLMEVGIADRSSPPSEAIQIGIASIEEIDQMLAVLRASKPACYMRALDLVPDGVDLAEVNRDWQRAGLSRERAVLTASREGKLAAAAIVECGETGSNLFRLVDSVRLVRISPDSAEALPSLLDAARDWFAERGKDAFVYFREDDDGDLDAATTLRDLGEGRLWIISSDLLPEFLEHVFEVTSPKTESSVPAVRKAT